MICKKCGKEIPDLTMYCPECGAPQFEPEKKEVNLVMPGKTNSKVQINSVKNLTNTITQIRAFTGMSFPEVKKLLNTLPVTLLDNLSEEEADRSAQMLQEEGVDAVAVHPGKKTEEVVTEKPVEPETVVEEEPVKEEIPAQPETEEEPVQEEKPSFEEEMAAFLQEEPKEKPGIELTLEPAIPAPEKPEENVPQLTLDPDHKKDDEFMKEMEEFLNSK